MSSAHLSDAVLVVTELMSKSIVVMGHKLGWAEADLHHLDLHSSCVDGSVASGRPGKPRKMIACVSDTMELVKVRTKL